jgi:hypothetical protein
MAPRSPVEFEHLAMPLSLLRGLPVVPWLRRAGPPALFPGETQQAFRLSDMLHAVQLNKRVFIVKDCRDRQLGGSFDDSCNNPGLFAGSERILWTWSNWEAFCCYISSARSHRQRDALTETLHAVSSSFN